MRAGRKRQGEIKRKTRETDVWVKFSIDGSGKAHINTGLGFFDHMIEGFTKHGLFDVEVTCQGDLHVDGHHTVEDVGLCLGAACLQAFTDAEGIRRFGEATVPMDDALVQAVVDVSGRPYLAYDIPCQSHEFAQNYAEEFFRAFATKARLTLHLRRISGTNPHHLIEAAFKAAARALRQALEFDSRIQGVLSTKGQLDLREGDSQ